MTNFTSQTFLVHIPKPSATIAVPWKPQTQNVRVDDRVRALSVLGNREGVHIPRAKVGNLIK